MKLKSRELLSSAFAPARLSPLMAIVLGSLLATTVGAGLFATYALLGPKSRESESAAAEWKPPTLAVVSLDPPKPASADVQTLSRPIFAKNRKPSRKAARTADAEEVETSEAPPGLSVSAIVKSGAAAHAFIISSEAPEGVWKKVGDMVDAWTIKSIAPSELVLKSGERLAKLKLYADPPQ